MKLSRQPSPLLLLTALCSVLPTSNSMGTIRGELAGGKPQEEPPRFVTNETFSQMGRFISTLRFGSSRYLYDFFLRDGAADIGAEPFPRRHGSPSFLGDDRFEWTFLPVDCEQPLHRDAGIQCFRISNLNSGRFLYVQDASSSLSAVEKAEQKHHVVGTLWYLQENCKIKKGKKNGKTDKKVTEDYGSPKTFWIMNENTGACLHANKKGRRSEGVGVTMEQTYASSQRVLIEPEAASPTSTPSLSPSDSAIPSSFPSVTPSQTPSTLPSTSSVPSVRPSASAVPSMMPSVSGAPSSFPSASPSESALPSAVPTPSPTLKDNAIYVVSYNELICPPGTVPLSSELGTEQCNPLDRQYEVLVGVNTVTPKTTLCNNGRYSAGGGTAGCRVCGTGTDFRRTLHIVMDSRRSADYRAGDSQCDSIKLNKAMADAIYRWNDHDTICTNRDFTVDDGGSFITTDLVNAMPDIMVDALCKTA